MTPAHDISLTERDASLLGPLAEQRLLTVPQVALLLGVTERTAVRRLRQLTDDRMVLLRPIFDGLPWAASIQSRGLRALGSSLQPPRLNLNEYRHDVGVGWLWLAARAGGFGELRELRTDRWMRARDAADGAAGRAATWGVGLGMLGRHGRPQRHYPDLMLELTSGHRVAIELELTAKSEARMRRIMTAYASDANVDHVLYLAANRGIATRVRAAASRAGIADRVHVQLLAPDGIAGAEIGRVRSPAAARSRVRQPSRAQRGTVPRDHGGAER